VSKHDNRYGRKAQGELKESARRAQGERKESARRAQGERKESARKFVNIRNGRSSQEWEEKRKGQLRKGGVRRQT
jgi:hypothetical protein